MTYSYSTNVEFEVRLPTNEFQLGEPKIDKISVCYEKESDCHEIMSWTGTDIQAGSILKKRKTISYNNIESNTPSSFEYKVKIHQPASEGEESWTGVIGSTIHNFTHRSSTFRSTVFPSFDNDAVETQFSIDASKFSQLQATEEIGDSIAIVWEGRNKCFNQNNPANVTWGVSEKHGNFQVCMDQLAENRNIKPEEILALEVDCSDSFQCLCSALTETADRKVNGCALSSFGREDPGDSRCYINIDKVNLESFSNCVGNNTVYTKYENQRCKINTGGWRSDGFYNDYNDIVKFCSDHDACNAVNINITDNSFTYHSFSSDDFYNNVTLEEESGVNWYIKKKYDL